MVQAQTRLQRNFQKCLHLYISHFFINGIQKYLIIVGVYSKKKNSLDYPFPRLDFAIKFFDLNEIHNAGLFQQIWPTFIYWITGAYPIKIQTYNINHMQGDVGKIVRAVTFKFNNIINLKDRQMARKYKLYHLFSDISEILQSAQVKQIEKNARLQFDSKMNQKRKAIADAYDAIASNRIKTKEQFLALKRQLEAQGINVQNIPRIKKRLFKSRVNWYKLVELVRIFRRR